MFRSFHQVLSPVLKSLGFGMEFRHRGELKLGLWRKKWSEKDKVGRLMLVPGLGDSPLTFFGVLMPLLPLIRQKYSELVVVDFPGFGGFLAHEKAFHSMDLLMGIMQDTFVELKPHTIIAHSLGGWVTGSFLQKGGIRKIKPQKTILISPAGFFPDDDDFTAMAFRFRDAFEFDFDEFKKHIFAKEPVWFPMIEKEFKQFFSKEEVKEFLVSIQRKHFLNDRLGKFEDEAWVIWGEKDELIKSKHIHDWLGALTSQFGQKNEQVHGLLLPNAGHLPHVERPIVTTVILGQILLNKTKFLEKTSSQLERFWNPVSPGQFKDGKKS